MGNEPSKMTRKARQGLTDSILKFSRCNRRIKELWNCIVWVWLENERCDTKPSRWCCHEYPLLDHKNFGMNDWVCLELLSKVDQKGAMVIPKHTSNPTGVCWGMKRVIHIYFNSVMIWRSLRDIRAKTWPEGRNNHIWQRFVNIENRGNALAPSCSIPSREMKS